MGWASGSRLMDRIIKSAKKNVPDEKARAKLYKDVIATFEDDGDWDTQTESMGSDPVFDKVMKKLHPDDFEWDEV